MFALALSSGLSQINATQALVSVSRAQMEARIYTDSVELFEEAVTLETGHREAAIDFLETAEKALNPDHGARGDAAGRPAAGRHPDARAKR